jgi:M6 family metalloprotease-like protein
LAFRRFQALLLITIFVSSAAFGFVTNPAAQAKEGWAHEFVPPMPQFSSEAAALNFTIPYPVPKPGPLFGQITVLVIAVDFKDYNHTIPIEQVTDNTITKLNDYYGRMSYGVASVVGKVVGWVRLPYTVAKYSRDNGPFIDDQDGDGYPDTWQLLRDAAPLIKDQVDPTAYEHIIVLHAGNGQESSRDTNDIWSVTYMRWTINTDQRDYERFAVVPESEARGLGTVGVYTHEFGHLLGLPDLYSSTMEQVGPWDLMARGAWNGRPAGSSPAEMIAWDRIFLGWLSASRILNVTMQSKMNATVDPIELPSSGIQAILVRASTKDLKQYYLIEVRQQIGFDVELPSSGVLITYIDETKSNPVKVIDAAQTTSSLDDAPFQVGQRYLDSKNSIVISVTGAVESSFLVVVDTSAPSPDVVIEDLSLDPPTVRPNSTVSLNVEVANAGTLKTKAFGVSIFLNDTLFASRRITLNAGERQLIQLSWSPKTTGSYTFKVVLDSEKVLPESNRDNNVMTLRVVVGYSLTLEVRPPDAGADLQWWLITNGVNETYVGIGEFQIGVVPGSNTLEIQPAIYVNPSSRYIFKQWGDGVTSNPRTITVSSDMRLSVDYSPQYRLSLEPNGGTISQSGWYDLGTQVTISATSPSGVVEKQSRLVFLNWSGDVQSDSTAVTITMNHPYNVTANWKPQYYLYVDSPYTATGEGWYDANAEVPVSTTPEVIIENGTRHLFVQWLGDLSGTDPDQLVVMSGPRSVSAVWNTQYELRIESQYGNTFGAGWYAPDVQATFSVSTLTIDGGNGTQHVFTGWTGDATYTNPQGTITMNGPKMVRANWDTQVAVTFVVKGIRDGTSLTIIVDGQRYTVKAPQTLTLWHSAGSPITFSTNATVTENFRRYTLVDWKNSTGGSVKSPQTVLDPETYTATFKQLSAFPCIIATVTFGSEVTPEVQFLRNFRDRLVLSTRAGSAFMTAFNMWYYSFSPQVADLIASHDPARGPIRVALYPLIGILQLSSATYSALTFSPEFAVVVAGIVASALIGIVYLSPAMFVITRLAARKKKPAIPARKICSISFAIAVAALLFGELTGSFGVLAVATSALVLTTLTSAAWLFSLMLGGLGSRLVSVKILKRVS